MRISRSVLIACLSAGILVASPVAGHAFDPEKVFEDKVPTSNKLFRFFFSARKNGQEEEAVSALKYAAEQGNQAAQWKLGRMYQIGDGVPKDPSAAYRFFEQIVERYSDAQPGSPEWQYASSAMVALGHYHRKGVPEAGIPQNADRAQIMFTTAATYFRNPEAQFELARMYLEGENPAGDIIQAARMLKKASKAGHPGAEALLGHILFEGEYLRREPVRGLSMMMKAQKRSTGQDAEWISQMQEEAFAVATEDQRRAAIALLQSEESPKQ